MTQSGVPWWTVADVHDVLNALPRKLPTYFGCVYAVEYGDLVKIGQTQEPFTRLKAVVSQAKCYGPQFVGRVVLTPPHTNYGPNERLVHQAFAGRRIRGELFRLTLEEVLSSLRTMELRNDSVAKAAKTEASLGLLKAIVKGEVFERADPTSANSRSRF